MNKMNTSKFKTMKLLFIYVCNVNQGNLKNKKIDFESNKTLLQLIQIWIAMT